MLAVLLSPCATRDQVTWPKNLLPVRYVYVQIRRDENRAIEQYREFDGPCKVVSTGTRQWTSEQFEGVKERFKRAGVHNGQLIIPSEEGSFDSPVSFLDVHTSKFSFDLHTMYLRFRWSGEQKTEDPVTEKALSEWQRLLLEATPVVQTKSGIAEITRIAQDCGKDWPERLSQWVCSDSREIIRHEQADKTVR